MTTQAVWRLYIVRPAGATRIELPNNATWTAVGGGNDCDVVADEPDFPQLAFQINRRPDGALWLYVHPARLWLDGQARRATLRDSMFPLADPTVIAMQGTATRFVLSRRAELSDATAFLAAAERAWAETASVHRPTQAGDGK